MQFPRFLLRQLARPHGYLAPVIAWILNRSNSDQIRRTIAALDLAAHHTVLDIGFGGGTSFPMLLRACGKVAGIDCAEPMLNRARRIWSDELARERLQLEHGSVAALPWGDNFFDRVLTVNTVYFWDDLEAGLHEVRRVLAPSGVFAMSVLPPETLEGWGYVTQGFRVEAPSFYAEALRRLGFEHVSTQETGDRCRSVVVQGTHPQARPEPTPR